MKHIEASHSRFLSKFVKGLKVNVRFTFGRTGLQLMHRAVELAEEHSLSAFMFPTPRDVGAVSVIQPVNTPMK